MILSSHRFSWMEGYQPGCARSSSSMGFCLFHTTWLFSTPETVPSERHLCAHSLENVLGRQGDSRPRLKRSRAVVGSHQQTLGGHDASITRTKVRRQKQQVLESLDDTLNPNALVNLCVVQRDKQLRPHAVQLRVPTKPYRLTSNKKVCSNVIWKQSTRSNSMGRDNFFTLTSTRSHLCIQPAPHTRSSSSRALCCVLSKT